MSTRGTQRLVSKLAGTEPVIQSYAAALAVFVAALLLTLAIPPLRQRSPFLLMIAAVAVGAWFWGTGPAVMLAGMSFVAVGAILAATQWPHGFADADVDIVRLAAFVTVCALVIALRHKRHDAEERLRSSERHFRLLIENTSDIITILDHEGIIRYESPSVQRVLGFDPGELIGRSAFELVHAEDRERAEQFFYDRVHKPGVMPNLELRVRCRDGSYRVLEAAGNVLLDEPGVFGVVIASRDITKRTQAAESLRSLLESAPDAIVGASAEGCIELVNSQTEHLFGYTREEMLGRPVELLLPQRFHAQHERLRREYASRPHVRPMGIGMELVGRRKDGTEFATEVSLSPMQSERGLLVTSIIRDITERKKAEAQRAELVRAQAARAEAEAARHRFHDLVQDLDAIVWEMEVDSGEITFITRRAQALLGYPPEQCMGKAENWLTHVHPQDREALLEFLRKVVSGGAPDLEYRALAADGRQLWLRLLVYVVRDQNNRPRQLRGLTVDITERKLAEDTLRMSEKLAATGRLAASIAHEINNPMAAVTNLLFLIGDAPGLDRSTRQYVALAQEEIARVTHITRQMLAFYRDATAPVPVNIPGLLQSTLMLYAHRLRDCNIEVKTDLRDVPEVQAFPGEMRQVFSNLLLNALEAVGKNGRIRLRVSSGRDWGERERSGIRILFADTGSGVRAEHRQRIFEPFFTTKGEKGTGLGLWVSSGIVQKHGGKIRVWSSTRDGNSGTCFAIFLPTATEPAEQAKVARAITGLAS